MYNIQNCDYVYDIKLKKFIKVKDYKLDNLNYYLTKPIQIWANTKIIRKTFIFSLKDNLKTNNYEVIIINKRDDKNDRYFDFSLLSSYNDILARKIITEYNLNHIIITIKHKNDPFIHIVLSHNNINITGFTIEHNEGLDIYGDRFLILDAIIEKLKTINFKNYI